MSKLKLLAGAAALFAHPGAGATPPEPPPVVRYEVSFPSLDHHEARIAARFAVPDRAPLRIEMARSSPGRYALHEFAKNVSAVSATDGAGRPLRVERTDPYGWTVAGHDGTVVFTYRLTGDRGDGTYLQIDPTHAHLNIPATFAFAPRLDGPVAVRFSLPDPSWRVATQLREGGATTFTAPHRQYFMDSPVEIAPLRFREWSANEGASNRRMRIALHSADSEADFDRFAAMAERVFLAQVAVWGDIPDYDYGTYTFLADYVPNASGDGMEHRNSTYIVDEQSLKEGLFSQVDTLSHELFHSWNVERMRPRELEPFDFARANPTPSLWLAEGFTSYYGPLALRRAGVQSVDRFLKQMSGTVSGVVNSPGRRFAGPAEMSLRAPFVDAATSIDPADPNIFTSYYPYGATIALALDLELRGRGKTLDQVMRALWARHGVTERPYTMEDVRAVLGEAGLGKDWADAFFARSIEGSALPDFAPLLAQAGLVIQPANPGKGWLGVAFAPEGKTVKVTRSPTYGSPGWAAGLDRGDLVTAIDGKPVTSEAEVSSALRAAVPGQRLRLQVTQRGRPVEVTLVAAPDPAFRIVRTEAVGGTLSPAQAAFRAAWLGAEGSMLPPGA